MVSRNFSMPSPNAAEMGSTESFLKEASGQNQAVGQEGLEINGVAGRQLCPAADGHRRNHAISETAGTAAGLVEQVRGQHGISGQKWIGVGENLSREGFGGRIQRSTQKLRPDNAAGVAGFGRLRSAPEFLMRRRASDEGLNEKVGCRNESCGISRTSTSGFAHGRHPCRRPGGIEAETFLQ